MADFAITVINFIKAGNFSQAKQLSTVQERPHSIKSVQWKQISGSQQFRQSVRDDRARTSVNATSRNNHQSHMPSGGNLSQHMATHRQPDNYSLNKNINGLRCNWKGLHIDV
jgi:hypothetical protein